MAKRKRVLKDKGNKSNPKKVGDKSSDTNKQFLFTDDTSDERRAEILQEIWDPSDARGNGPG